MGLKFGNLYKIRGIIYYRLSPYEQSPTAGLISKGFPNIIRRCLESAHAIVPSFLFGYLSCVYLDHLFEEGLRKDPTKFENDV